MFRHRFQAQEKKKITLILKITTILKNRHYSEQCTWNVGLQQQMIDQNNLVDVPHRAEIS